MKTLDCYIDGIGVIGPGINDWPAARAIFKGQAAYFNLKTVAPSPAALPAAERRRCGPLVKLSIAVGHEAAAAAGIAVATLPTVFSASGGDGDNCHEICAMLASDDRQISPTRFHNSVHNAASGYWSIATGAMAPSSVLCAFDGSFGAGLLEAVTQAVVGDTCVLLIAGDTPYPEPLHGVRNIADAFGVGLVIAPRRSARSLARMTLALTAGPSDVMADSMLEAVRKNIPAARSLPLLRAVALGEAGSLVLDYLDRVRLCITLQD